MDDLAGCAAKFIRFADGFAGKANEIMQKVALAVDQAVVLGTPVDKGRARSNWIASVSIESFEFIEPYSPGDMLGISESANAQGALDQAQRAIATRQSGERIFLVNNATYIIPLNNGHSAQAPINFIETAIMEGIAAIREVRLVDL